MRAGVLGIAVLGGLAYLILSRTASANSADIGNPFYFSLGKTVSGQAQTLSQAGLQAIKSREGFSPVRYPDPPGQNRLFSIWYGHQIKPGDDLSLMTPDQTLLDDTQAAADAVNENVSADLTQAQFDALVSFVYNVGIPAFKHGTVPQKLNDGDFKAATDTMLRYIHDQGGAVDPVLANRRASEVAQFYA